ncbi:MAG: hypothetical protein VX885_00655 [Actinomycetota bacterium]|nr:hypothetical protein [Actinomycetota bacterium]
MSDIRVTLSVVVVPGLSWGQVVAQLTNWSYASSVQVGHRWFGWLKQTTGHRYFPELWTVWTRFGT